MVEAIAAITIAAIAGAGLIAALSSARGRADEADHRRAALQQASLLIAEALVAMPATSEPLTGVASDNRMTWSVQHDDVDTLAPGLRRIEVVVTWRGARRSGEIVLEAYGLHHAQ